MAVVQRLVKDVRHRIVTHGLIQVGVGVHSHVVGVHRHVRLIVSIRQPVVSLWRIVTVRINSAHLVVH